MRMEIPEPPTKIAPSADDEQPQQEAEQRQGVAGSQSPELVTIRDSASDRGRA